MSASDRRVRLPRRIRPGALPSERPGDKLTCLVLSRSSDEWVGADLGSGAFVRVPGLIDLPGGDERPPVVVEFTITRSDDPPDPSRPELVTPSSRPVRMGTVRPRAVRRFLRRLATPESAGATILGTRGPSIAFVDLDGNASSIELLKLPAKRLELGTNAAGQPDCMIPWGGTTQRTRIADPDAARAAAASAPRVLRGAQISAALGFRPNFVLVGLGRVTGGHAPKLVLALL